MKSRVAFIGCLTAFGCAQPQRAETGAGASRFHDTEAIVVAPMLGPVLVLTGESPIVPRFPAGRVGSSARVAPAVAYVVDTSGAIEPRTVSFLNAVPADYRRVVCEWSRGVRFEPVVTDGVRRRSLSVSSFTFFRSETPFPPGGGPDVAQQWLSTFRGMPVNELFSMLEKSPHC